MFQVIKRKFSHPPKKIFEILAVLLLILINGYHFYTQYFPESIDSLIKKSDISWAESKRKAEELLEYRNPQDNKTSVEIKYSEEIDSAGIYKYFPYILRVLAIIIGFFLLYVSFALHENKEGKIQNKLEEIWIKIDDAQTSYISTHTAFVNAVSGIVTRIFDFFFGNKLLSIQAIGVSICYAIFSANFVELLFTKQQAMLSDSLFNCIFFFILGSLPTLNKKSSFIYCWFFIIALILWNDFVSSYFSFILLTNSWGIPVMTSAGIGVLIGGIVGCILFWLTIILFRRILRFLSVSKSFWATALIPLLTFVPVSLLIFSSYLFTLLLNVMSDLSVIFFIFFLLYFLSINIIILFPSLLFLFVSLILIFHKLIWGFTERPIYILQKLGVVKRNKLIGYIGATLFVAGIGGWEWIKTILDKLI